MTPTVFIDQDVSPLLLKLPADPKVHVSRLEVSHSWGLVVNYAKDKATPSQIVMAPGRRIGDSYAWAGTKEDLITKLKVLI